MSDPNIETTKPDFRKRVGYQGALVGGIALLASAMLIIGHDQTKGAIARSIDADTQAMLGELIPKESYDNNLVEDRLTLTSKEISTLTEPLDVYRARKNGDVTAVIFKVAERGYSGLVTMILAIDRNGKVINVRVVSHTETPGLGDKMEASRSKWIFSFNGRALDDPEEEKWKVKKDGGIYDQWSGATITPRAIVLSIKKGLILFKENRELMLDPNTSTREEQKS